MARLLKRLKNDDPRYFETVLGSQESSRDTAFDSELEMSKSAVKNCKLRIGLRVYYNQLNPGQLPEVVLRSINTAMGTSSDTTWGAHSDANGKRTLIKGWKGDEWTNFIQEAKKQAGMWDGKFWLIPPPEFWYLDFDYYWIGHGEYKYRPNIQCQFEFSAHPVFAGAHGQVDVVNLAKNESFRPHSYLHSSRDMNLKTLSGTDMRGVTNSYRHWTITHEVGHLLGLPHVGVSKSLAPCITAIAMNYFPHQDSVPALYKGGKNADVCYGDLATQGDLDDIMGSGSKFGTQNAQPWLDRLFEHLNFDGITMAQARQSKPRWTVSTHDQPPRRV